jgi:hypothetical protein
MQLPLTQVPSDTTCSFNISHLPMSSLNPTTYYRQPRATKTSLVVKLLSGSKHLKHPSDDSNSPPQRRRAPHSKYEAERLQGRAPEAMFRTHAQSTISGQTCIRSPSVLPMIRR